MKTHAKKSFRVIGVSRSGRISAVARKLEEGMNTLRGEGYRFDVREEDNGYLLIGTLEEEAPAPLPKGLSWLLEALGRVPLSKQQLLPKLRSVLMGKSPEFVLRLISEVEQETKTHALRCDSEECARGFALLKETLPLVLRKDDKDVSVQ